MISCSWLWVYAGCALMFLELIVPGFVLFFFGLAAATVGVLRAVFGEAFDVSWQLATFSLASVVYIAVLRRLLKKVFVGGKVEAATDFDNESVGRVGRVTEPIDPPKSGRVLLGDAEWTAVADTPIASGSDVRVVAQNNLTMSVEKL